MLLVAQCITGGGIFETYGSGNIAGVAGFYILTVVSVHLQDASHTLSVLLDRVVNAGACVNSTGVNTEEANLTDERVGCDFKRKSGERLCIGRVPVLFLAGLGVGTLNSLNVGRSRHIIDNSVQERLNALVSV